VIGRGGKKSSVSISYQYCDRCGLIALKNEATARAAKAPCRGTWPEAATVYMPFKARV
jgi:hypothetical protein